MQFEEIAKDVFYVKDVFPKHKEFISKIENEDSNEKIYSVIPKWTIWHEYDPVLEDGQFINKINETVPSNGFKKVFDWDHTLSYNKWPRIKVDSKTSEAHSLAEPIIEMFEVYLKELLAEWCNLNNNEEFEYITRNYCIKKYLKGGSLGSHIDVNENNPLDTQDWTVLIYLNDDYEGGELGFTDKTGKETRITPKAGSAIIFPTNLVHWVEEIKNGNKYFMFFYIHSKHKTFVAIDEIFYDMHKLKNKYEVKQRILIDGSSVLSYEKPIDLIIHTKAPAKWKIIDMETGEEYLGSEIKTEFAEILRNKIITGKMGTWVKIKGKIIGDKNPL